MPVDSNPVDAVWPDRPPAPLAPVLPHPDEFAGESSAAKRTRIAGTVKAKGADVALITAPDSIAWLLNVRGGDVPRTPFALGFALLHGDGHVDLFMDRRKVPDRTLAWLGNAVTLAPPDELGAALDMLGKVGKRVLIETRDRAGVGRDPTAGGRRGAGPRRRSGGAAQGVQEHGRARGHPRAPIAATAPRSAASWAGSPRIARAANCARSRPPTGCRRCASETGKLARPELRHHFRRRPERRHRALPRLRGEPAHARAGQLYLVDSGGQYRDGTTDITRTVAIGTPSAEMRDRFTRVLKGHIALAMARFPAGTTGSQLDALARYALWQAGLDYDHGTGHGVGAYLSVHEGPQRISKMANNVALQPGMIVTNEPGYYKTGAYGIRIENLVAVREATIDGADRRYLEFETLTLAPIDLDLHRARPADRCRTAMAQRLSPPRARDGGAAGRRGDTGVARRGDARRGSALILQDSSAQHDVFIDMERRQSAGVHEEHLGVGLEVALGARGQSGRP